MASAKRVATVASGRPSAPLDASAVKDAGDASGRYEAFPLGSNKRLDPDPHKSKNRHSAYAKAKKAITQYSTSIRDRSVFGRFLSDFSAFRRTPRLD